MTRLVFAPGALRDIERLTDFLIEQDAYAAGATARILIEGLGILKQHPLIGREAEAGLRELVISRGRSGYVALYRFDVAADTALVLALRHQREGGYA
ncbi:MAG: type II toxin-antitoxin system RelE/ParE family toxin [Rhodocyclaceae bacterium]|mgnify:FL=1|nr:type II toxin-antitoxin system RelE/ParE family toxin [Rhodocyclaceae bacterium]MCL4680171.1 type II toxin-antitoxin system RelE/ParE family toxin [Rhodocyclaceae bacterium]